MFINDIITKEEQQKLSKESLENINKLISIANDENIIKLPTKLNTCVWIVTPIMFSKETIEIPIGCTCNFTEVCETCEHYKKDCNLTAYAQKIFFYLGSSYAPLVINNWNTLVFDNMEDCIKKCKELYNPEFVDIAQKRYIENNSHIVDIQVDGDKK